MQKNQDCNYNEFFENHIFILLRNDYRPIIFSKTSYFLKSYPFLV